MWEIIQMNEWIKWLIRLYLYVANSPNERMYSVVNKTAFICGKLSKWTDELSG